MSARLIASISFCMLLSSVPVPGACAPSERGILHAFRIQANDLARRKYLVELIPQLSATEQGFARQLLAMVDDELGLYNEAITDFPFDARTPLRHPLPWVDQSAQNSAYAIVSYVHDAGNVNAAGAVDAIAADAAKHRIVLINEAHNDAQTRALILAMLPRLRALGYDYFAAEALTESGSALMKRGYPIADSGSEYVHESIYADILREAVRLGYTIVAYDPIDSTEDRDAAQAENLNREIFAKHPDARLFALVGYAHVDKAKGNLGALRPMAMQLHELTGLDPLTVDQTQFRDVEPSAHVAPYDQVIDLFHPRDPIVLQLRGSRIWSSDPLRYDISVILPEMPGKERPGWLSLDGLRRAWLVSAALCHGTIPCVVEARYGNESDDAIPADRYTFLNPHGSSALYLRPGTYRLHAWGIDGKSLAEATIHVAE
ncbi:MAG: hypothetical protein ABI227_10410 [Rhodanobacter sp.]